MSLISFRRNDLRSNVVRNVIGQRTVDIFAEITTPEGQNTETGFFEWIVGLGKRLAGFLLRVVGRAFGWLIRNAIPFLIEATLTVATFDWNQTDSSIREQINQNNNQIAQALGEAIGSGFVWLTTITLAGGASLRFPVLSGRVALALAEEGGEELRGQIVNALTQTRQAMARSLVLGGLLTARRLRLFGLEPVSDQREPWSFAGQIEKKIEALPDNLIQPFVEGLTEGASDALIEAGYVISYALDEYYSSSRFANEGLLGEQRAVKLYPDRDNEEEFVVLRGPQELVKQEIQSTIAAQRWISSKDVGQIYGMPTETYQESVKFKPQIRLWFLEDYEDVDQGFAPISAEISFRLMGETSQSITPADAQQLAGIVRSQFGDAGGFRFQKGRVKCSYRNPERGYNLVLSVTTEAEGRRVISNVLDVQGHSFDAEFMTIAQLAEAPPIVPSNELIYGQSRRPPRRRPVGWVRFQWAELHIHGMPNPVVLVDRTRRRKTALIKVT